jgi:ABC-type protease/lipase transport system fused ATPase/permease subunit
MSRTGETIVMIHLRESALKKYGKAVIVFNGTIEKFVKRYFPRRTTSVKKPRKKNEKNTNNIPTRSRQSQ